MRILFLCTFYHSAMLFQQQKNFLKKKGHDVKVFNSAEYGDRIADKFVPIMNDSDVVHVECWNRLDRFLFFPRQWKIEKKLQAYYNLKEFDLLHAHLMLSSGYSALRMKKKYGIPYVVSVRVTDLKGFIKIPIFRNLARKILLNANGILFLSNSHKNELFERYIDSNTKKRIENKCVVIGNSVETFWEKNIYLAKHELVTPGLIHVITVAKIKPVKNITTACKAIEILNKNGIPSKLTIVGENQDNVEYERIKAYSNVEIIDFMKKEELISYYRSNDIFLLPSISETFGRTYVEAMTQGLPVIYSKNQGFDGFYPNGFVGFAVEAMDEVQIVEAIKKISNDIFYYSNNCIQSCEAFFEEKIADQLSDFYEKAMN